MRGEREESKAKLETCIVLHACVGLLEGIGHRGALSWEEKRRRKRESARGAHGRTDPMGEGSGPSTAAGGQSCSCRSIEAETRGSDAKGGKGSGGDGRRAGAHPARSWGAQRSGSRAAARGLPG